MGLRGAAKAEVPLCPLFSLFALRELLLYIFLGLMLASWSEAMVSMLCCGGSITTSCLAVVSVAIVVPDLNEDVSGATGPRLLMDCFRIGDGLNWVARTGFE